MISHRSLLSSNGIVCKILKKFSESKPYTSTPGFDNEAYKSTQESQTIKLKTEMKGTFISKI